MAKELKFKTANGDVSLYSLACGYIQKRETSPGVEVTLWREGACYHVKVHDFNEHRRLFWFSSESLTECRKVYKSRTPQKLICKTLNTPITMP